MVHVLMTLCINSEFVLIRNSEKLRVDCFGVFMNENLVSVWQPYQTQHTACTFKMNEYSRAGSKWLEARYL